MDENGEKAKMEEERISKFDEGNENECAGADRFLHIFCIDIAGFTFTAITRRSGNEAIRRMEKEDGQRGRDDGRF